jgi:uncharacterized protein (UPF0128 family)
MSIDQTGCGSVRVFRITENGVTSEVITSPIPVEPKVAFSVVPGSGNSREFKISYSGGLLWGHCLAFGDGDESKFCFDGPAGELEVSHDYDYKGGTFEVTLTVQTDQGPMAMSADVIVK